MSQSPERLTEFDVRGQKTTPGAPAAGSGAVAESRMVGWVLFAGVIMILTGVFEAILGMTAVFFNGYFEATQDPLVTNDYDTWGWVHTVLGVAAVAAGFGLFRGKLWARVLGILFALTIAVINLGFISVAPVWCVMVIVMCVICVFAITVHGDELQEW